MPGPDGAPEAAEEFSPFAPRYGCCSAADRRWRRLSALLPVKPKARSGPFAPLERFPLRDSSPGSSFLVLPLRFPARPATNPFAHSLPSSRSVSGCRGSSSLTSRCSYRLSSGPARRPIPCSPLGFSSRWIRARRRFPFGGLPPRNDRFRSLPACGRI